MKINNHQRIGEKFATDLLEMQTEIKKQSGKFSSLAVITEYLPKLKDWNDIREQIAVRIINENLKDNRRTR